MADPREYLYFYLIGRRDEELACSIDLDIIAKRVFAGESLRDVVHRFASDAAGAAELDGFKRDWLADNRGEIAEAGGDEEKAYALYRQGQIDELAVSLEPEVLQEVQYQLDDMGIAERANNRETTSEDDDPEGPSEDDDEEAGD